MGKVDAIFAAAFNMPRDPRSPEYKQGVLDALRFRLGEVSTVRWPYPPDSAQSDAYFSGVDEGHRRAREQTAPADPSTVELKGTTLLADAHRYRWLRERNLDTFTTGGNFPVSLTVTDNRGDTATTTINIAVGWCRGRWPRLRNRNRSSQHS